MRLAAGLRRTTRDSSISSAAKNRQAHMTSKKKSRPMFEVPEALESGAQSGWVYRSGADVESEAGYESVDGASVQAASLATFSLAVATMAQALALGMAIAALPWTMGLRTVKSFTKQSD